MQQLQQSKDRSDRACPAISTIPGNQSSAIVNDHMETEGGLYFGKSRKNFTTFSHSDFGIIFRCKWTPRDNFLGDGNIC